MADGYELFNRLSSLINALPDTVRATDVLTPAFQLHSEDGLSIYYVPFDYVNDHARVAIVGVTPGEQQMVSAYQSAARALHAGLSSDEVLRRVAQDASFVGSMRTNLVKMLDEIGLAECLDIASSQMLFSEHDDLVHTTSAIRYAVFVNGQNYTGHAPPILQPAVFRHYIEHLLRDELERAKDSLVVPLGKAATEAVYLLVAERAIEHERCLLGFPHPSGANGHRLRLFSEAKTALRATTRQWFECHG